MVSPGGLVKFSLTLSFLVLQWHCVLSAYIDVRIVYLTTLIVAQGTRGSVPDGRGFDSRCHWIFLIDVNPSSRTMVLVSTQPLTEMSTRNIPVGKGQPAHKTDNLTAICELIV
jgi:hypothetical protein